jgi:hypothetical protein
MQQQLKGRIMNKAKLLALGTTGILVANSALAVGEPVDLEAAGTSIAGYVPVAAGWGIGVFVAMVGLRVIMRAFRAVAK